MPQTGFAISPVTITPCIPLAEVRVVLTSLVNVSTISLIRLPVCSITDWTVVIFTEDDNSRLAVKVAAARLLPNWFSGRRFNKWVTNFVSNARFRIWSLTSARATHLITWNGAWTRVLIVKIPRQRTECLAHITAYITLATICSCYYSYRNNTYWQGTTSYVPKA